MPIPMDWPEKQLNRHPVREVFVCGHKLHPPLYSHVVTFPRLEIPLQGGYENQIESEGRMVSVRLEPGAVLFAPPELLESAPLAAQSRVDVPAFLGASNWASASFPRPAAAASRCW